MNISNHHHKSLKIPSTSSMDSFESMSSNAGIDDGPHSDNKTSSTSTTFSNNCTTFQRNNETATSLSTLLTSNQVSALEMLQDEDSAILMPPPPAPRPLSPQATTLPIFFQEPMDMDYFEATDKNTEDTAANVNTSLSAQQQQDVFDDAAPNSNNHDNDADNNTTSTLPVGPHIEYSSVAELQYEFQKYMREPLNVEAATEYLYDSLLDEAVLGAVFEWHYAQRTGLLAAVEGELEDQRPFQLVSGPDIDVFGTNCTKIQMDVTCPKCDRSVAASRFAPHLEKCMGMGRISSRIASRRLASRDGNNYFGGAQSDDEDDADWAGEKRKKKIQPVRTNGGKKNGKSSS